MSRIRGGGLARPVPSLEALESRVTPSASNLFVAGAVFNDLNANGLRDRGEEGISGASLQLVSSRGVIVGNATTDDSGAFMFDRDARLSGQTAVVSHVGTFTRISSSQDQVVSLPRFDPALGTLTGIEIEVNAQLDAVASLENLNSTSAVLRVTHENAITVTGPGGPMAGEAPAQTFTGALGAYDGVNDSSGASGFRFPQRSSSVNILVEVPGSGDEGAESTEPGMETGTDQEEAGFGSVVEIGIEEETAIDSWAESGTGDEAGFDPGLETGIGEETILDPIADSEGEGLSEEGEEAIPEGFLPFVGAGSVAFQAAITGQASSQGPGNYQFAVESSATATITIRYTYQPADALAPGEYTVMELAQPEGYLDGRESPDGVAAITGSWLSDEIHVTLGSVPVTRLGFGEVLPATLSGSAFIDANGDALFDFEEAGAEGVLVTLGGVDDTGAPVTRQAEAAADAAFTFENLRPGVYSVSSSLLSRFIAGPGVPGEMGGVSGPASIAAILLESGSQAAGYMLPQAESAAVGGVVYLDRNADGIRDEGEPGIAHQAVSLQGTNGYGEVQVTVVTNALGEFTFNGLAPGTYAITSPAKGGYKASGTEAGAQGGIAELDSISEIVIAAGDLADGFLLGRTAVLAASGRAFVDRNASGAFDAGDKLLAGVRVFLTGITSAGESITRQTVTNARGAYTFPRLPDGLYRISARTPAGVFAARAIAGSSGGRAGASSVAGIDLGPSGNAKGYDFPMAPPSKVSGVVYHDLDRNGVLSSRDYGLGGIQLILSGNDDLGRVVRKATVTTHDGTYNFGNLRAGSYTVSRGVPSGFQAGTARVGSLGGAIQDGAIGLALGFGNAALRYDFAMIQNLAPGPGRRHHTA